MPSISGSEVSSGVNAIALRSFTLRSRILAGISSCISDKRLKRHVSVEGLESPRRAVSAILPLGPVVQISATQVLNGRWFSLSHFFKAGTVDVKNLVTSISVIYLRR